MTQFPQQGNAPAIDPTAEIQRLSKTALELSDLIRAHRDTLAQRGMTAPTGAPENLQTIGSDLQRLTSFLDNSQIELQQLRELARTTDLVNSTLDLDIVLDDVIDTVIQLTGAERGYIVLKDPETEELVFRVARDKNKQDINPGQFVVSRTIVERVAKQGELLVTVNALEDNQFKDVESVANLQLRSILCVPLKRKGVITGVIYADNRMRPNLFSAREQKLVNAFANQAAVAIENARLFERVRISLEEITTIKDFMYDVFASIASGVITTDAENHITTFNSAAARILDVPPDNAIGQPLFSVLPPLYEGFDRLVADVRQHNLNQTVEVDPVLDTRGQVSLDLKLSPLKDGEVTQGVAIVVDDLTELKQRQAQIGAVRRYLPPEMVDNIKTIDELELGGVEREVSILFCDVRGFTTFSESLQPEELMETINQYLTVSSDAIHSYGGIIDKYMGDAVVGLFNTQLNPQDDHALRAVSAGLLMAQKVLQLHADLPESKRLFYGIGVHTGPAVLGNVGSPRRKEFTAIGNSLQFAKLLQENALGGEVIISEETYNILNGYVEAEALEPRKVKDHPEFKVMYRVTNIRA
jgi:adenylate cyclase